MLEKHDYVLLQIVFAESSVDIVLVLEYDRHTDYGSLERQYNRALLYSVTVTQTVDIRGRPNP